MTIEQFFEITRQGELGEYLKQNGFYTAPASTRFHGCYEGGLFDHSKNVMQALVTLTKENHLKWEEERSPYLVGMFHDLCKIDNYRHPVTGYTLADEPIHDSASWEYNTDSMLKGHGDKSVMLLSQFFTLTEEEIMCIRYHMGAFTDKEEWSDYTRAIHKYPNVLWTHQADMIATHIVEAAL